MSDNPGVFMQSLCRTGRTGRLLADAERLANAGRAVYVVSVGLGDARELEQRFGAEKANRLGVSFEPLGRLRIDWRLMRPVGVHPNAVFLFDHYVIESQFSRMVEMLHRYDCSPGGLLSANAAMLQRWAVLANLLDAEGDLRVDAILGVAEVSAREFVAGGPEYGGERLLRQEAAARALIEVKSALDNGEVISPGDELHVFVMRAVSQLSSYPGVGGSPG